MSFPQVSVLYVLGCSLDLEFVVFAGCVNKGERMRVNVSKNEET
jgi:hypothetical protein